MKANNAKWLLSLLLMHTLLKSDIVGPFLISADEVPVTLSANSANYALSGDVAGNITITGNDVSLNLNEHVVTGRIIISGQRAFVYGGKIVAPAPADNATADAGVVQINSAAVNTQIADVFVAAADGTVAGVRGARGMQVDADDVIIRNSFIAGGNGGPNNGISDGGAGLQGGGNRMMIQQTEIFGGDGSNSTNGTTNTGSGGSGLFITGGDGSQLLSVNVTAGQGGNVAAGGAAIVGPRVFGNGGGNRIDGTNVLVQDSRLYAGVSNTVSTTSTMSTGGAFTGGNGGIGLSLVNANASVAITRSEIRGGGSVALSVGTAGAAGFGITQGSAGAGLSIASANANVQVANSTITGGSSGSLVATGNINSSTSGMGGDAVSISSITASVAIDNVVVVGGDSATITAAGGIASSANVTRSSSGNGITSSALELMINNSSIEAGHIPLTSAATVGLSTTFLDQAGNGVFLSNSSGNVQCNYCVVRGGTSGGITATGNIDNISFGTGPLGAGEGGGGVGIWIAQLPDDTKIVQSIFDGCDVYGGQAGTITSGGAIASVLGANGIPSGTGIRVFATNLAFTREISVLNSTITASHGGDQISTVAGGARVAGRSGGGIIVSFVDDATRIHNCSILAVGRGGNITDPGANGTGAASRDGISIGTSTNVEVSNNSITNVDAGGTGPAGSGTSGRALVNTGTSCFIVSNYASTIANATKYALGAAGQYVDAVATGTDFLDLVSVPDSSHRLTNVYEA